MRTGKHRLLLAVVLLGHSALAASAMATHHAAAGESAKLQAWRAAAVASLLERADADSLATAAAFMFAAPAPALQSEGLLIAGRAAAISPNDAAVGWLRLRLCAMAAACDFRSVATDMRWLDAENAAAWLPNLAAAYREHDAIEVDRVLMDMAQSKRLDVYWNRIVVFMFESLRTAEKFLPGAMRMTDAARLALVEGTAGPEVLPPFTALMDACRDAATGTERRESCLKVAKLMQRSDAIPAQMAGLAIERHALRSDSREARALAERRHVLEWRSATAAKFDAPLLPWLRNSRARWRLARMRSLGSDEDVTIAILREQGMPLEPPKEKR